MFSNIGKKIKGLALILCIISIACFALMGIGMIIGGIIENSNRYSHGAGTPLIVIGLIVIPIGVLISWISSFVLYGYGQLIHSVQNIEAKICPEYVNAPTPAPAPAPAPVPAGRTCPHCGYLNDDYSKFCVRCGSNL